MFSICGGAATFLEPTVTNIMAPGTNDSTSVCISGSSSVTLVNGTFLGSGIRPVGVGGKGATAQIIACRFAGNNITKSQIPGGALLVANSARISIRSSTFVGNAAMSGGAVAAGLGAKVEVVADCPPG